VKITALKKTRQEKGITQEVLAENAKVAIRSYKYYESGERTPSVTTAQLLAKALGVKVSDIFPYKKKNR